MFLSLLFHLQSSVVLKPLSSKGQSPVIIDPSATSAKGAHKILVKPNSLLGYKTFAYIFLVQYSLLLLTTKHYNLSIIYMTQLNFHKRRLLLVYAYVKNAWYNAVHLHCNSRIQLWLRRREVRTYTKCHWPEDITLITISSILYMNKLAFQV